MIFFNKKQQSSRYFFPDTQNERLFSQTLHQEIAFRKAKTSTLILLCIGTDKITGDCLGPLVGTKLQEQHYPHPVYGTLQYPVHAVNLSSVLSGLHQRYSDPFFLVVDAAVGPAEKIGCVSLSPFPLYPGKGIQRPLPPVGNLSLTGIISRACETSEMDLPYTRLYTVNTLAEFICRAIIKTENC